MFDIGWTEIVTIGILAILIIGPKDLPKAMRTIARYVGKARAMMREFQANLDDMIKDSELEEVKNQIQQARKFDVKSEIVKTVDESGDLRKSVDMSKEKSDFDDAVKDTPSDPDKQKQKSEG